MNSNFSRALDKIVNQLDPDSRASAGIDRDHLVEAGVDSEAALEARAQDSDTEPGLRAIACWFLARLGSPGAFNALRICLDDPNPALRAEAARGLGTLGDPNAVDALLATMQNDDSPHVRLAAIYALGLLDDERKIEPIIAKLEDRTEDAAVRGMAAETLGNSLDPRAIEPLIEALGDPEVEVRFWAAFAVGELGAEAALPELYRLAAEDDAILPGWWSVRQEAQASIDLIENQSDEASDQPGMASR